VGAGGGIAVMNGKTIAVTGATTGGTIVAGVMIGKTGAMIAKIDAARTTPY
jgi:hypothetical protein